MNPVRMLVALLVWAGAIGGVAELTHLADDYAHGGTKSAAATATATAAPAATETTDLSRELPPRPHSPVLAGDPRSLYAWHNLEAMLNRVYARFGSAADVVGFALYPGEADFVIAQGGEVRVVRAPARRGLVVGDPHGFAGTRQAVALRQIQAPSLAHTLRFVVKHAPLPIDAISRVVLDTTSRGDLAGYRLETQSGVTSYTSLLTGGAVTAITPGGTHQLR
jgi:hypothetical protein